MVLYVDDITSGREGRSSTFFASRLNLSAQKLALAFCILKLKKNTSFVFSLFLLTVLTAHG